MAEEAIYVSKASRFRTRVEIFDPKDKDKMKDVFIEFKDCVYRTDNPEIEKALDEARANSPAFNQEVRKVDKDAAAKAAAEHRVKHGLTGQVVKGGVTAAHIDAMKQTNLKERDAALAAQIPEETSEAFHKQMRDDNDLMLTESAKDAGQQSEKTESKPEGLKLKK